MVAVKDVVAVAVAQMWWGWVTWPGTVTKEEVVALACYSCGGDEPYGQGHLARDFPISPLKT
ncbi:hypothetical protein HN873_024703, partial [Arachis hypogaea]